MGSVKQSQKQHVCNYYCQGGWHCALVYGRPLRDGWHVVLKNLLTEFGTITVRDVQLARELPITKDAAPWLVWFQGVPS